MKRGYQKTEFQWGELEELVPSLVAPAEVVIRRVMEEKKNGYAIQEARIKELVR